MSQAAVSQLHQELRKCFQSVKASQSVWRGVLEECAPLVSSLGNLAEQLRALRSVEITNTPLSTFPNVAERLQYKLLNAVDTVLGQLRDKMSVVFLEIFDICTVCIFGPCPEALGLLFYRDALGSVRDSVCQQVSAVFHMYEQNSNSLPISTCVARCALSPSIADMLEWLQDTERYYRIQYPRSHSVVYSCSLQCFTSSALVQSQDK